MPTPKQCLDIVLHACAASLALTVILVLFVSIPSMRLPQMVTPDKLELMEAVTRHHRDIASVVPHARFDSTPEDFHRLLDLAPFDFSLNVASCANHTPVQLVVLVHSALGHAHHRQTIRSTWGSLPQIRLLFLLGLPAGNESAAIQDDLLQEQTAHLDLVQGNFIDTYRNMSYKHAMALKWIFHFCSEDVVGQRPRVSHVLKTDDDVFINTPGLLATLPMLPRSHLIYCDVMRRAYVKRSWRSKWRVSYQEYAAAVYPDYCAGWAILYSTDVVNMLYAELQDTPPPVFWVDDVNVSGIMALRAGLRHTSATAVVMDDTLYEWVVHNHKWPKTRNVLLGPYNIDPQNITFLWQVLQHHQRHVVP